MPRSKLIETCLLLRTVAREFTSRQYGQRVTEPDLVMDNPENVAAYVEAGREHGVMAPVYLYHCINICEVIKPGDTVVDLACGPANQLAMVARLNPDIQFIGVDLSEPMLERARELIGRQGLKNVSFRHGDITDLSSFADKSIDAVMSTMALHHLPTVGMLGQTYAEVARILKDGGGVYMADFGRLKRHESIEYFANQYVDKQPKLFTEDYYNSLRAAFTPEDFAEATKALEGRARIYKTAGLAYMVVLKSETRRELPSGLMQELMSMRASLAPNFRHDFKNLHGYLKRGGLRTNSIQ